MTRSAYVLACVLACLASGHAVPFDCQTMTHLGLPSGCLLGLKTASNGTLAVCKDVLCKKLLTDTGGNAEWIINPNDGCTLTPRGAASVQDLICVSGSAIQPSVPTPVPDTAVPATPAPDNGSGGLPVWVVVCLLVFIPPLCAGVVAYCWRTRCARVRSEQPGNSELPAPLCKSNPNSIQYSPMQMTE